MSIVAFHTIAPNRFYLQSGVTFFYVLSGFILTYVHPRIEGRIATFRFLINRIARIWPLHLLTLAVVICFYSKIAAVKYPHVEEFLNVFLLQAWVPIEHVAYSYNGVSWSLSVELFFYLMFPLLLPLVWKAPGKILIGALAVNGFLTVMVTWLYLRHVLPEQFFTYSSFISLNPVMNLYKFVFGMALGTWWMTAQKTPAFLPWAWVEVVALIGAVCAVPLTDSVARMVMGEMGLQLMSRQMHEFMIVPCFGLLIYVFAYQKGALSRILSHKWLVFLGDISFSIYMLQKMYLLFNLNLSSLSIKWCLYVAVLIGVSGVTYVFFEKPARRSIVRLTDPILKRLAATPGSAKAPVALIATNPNNS